MKSFEMPAEQIMLYELYRHRLLENVSIIDDRAYSNLCSFNGKVNKNVKKRAFIKRYRKSK